MSALLSEELRQRPFANSSRTISTLGEFAKGRFLVLYLNIALRLTKSYSGAGVPPIISLINKEKSLQKHCL